MKISYFLLILLISISGYSQCPGATAISYKNKAKNLGPQEFSKQQAYIQLATYYAYKCECENGSPRSAQLVSMINSLVDTYSAYTKNAYGTMSKVSSCKSQDGIGNSETTGDTGNPNASNHGSGVNIEPKKNFIETLMSDLGITETDLQNILNGTFEEAISNMKYNQDIENISKITSDNKELASGLYDLANTFGERIRKNRIEDAEKIVNKIKSLEKKLNTKTDFTSESKVNFNDNSFELINNEYAIVEVLNDSSVIFKSKNYPKYNDRDLDFPMLVLNSNKFSIYQDFLIEFELGFNTDLFYESKEAYRLGIASMFALFLSNTNKISLSSKSATATYNFNNIYDFSKTKYYSEIYELNKSVHKDLFFSFNSVYNIDESWDLSSANAIKKSDKKLRKEWSKLFDKNSRNYNQTDSITFTKYKIQKIKDVLHLEVHFELDGKKEILKFLKPFEFKYIDVDKLYFGIGFNGFYSYGKGVTYFGTDTNVILRNLIIKQ